MTTVKITDMEFKVLNGILTCDHASDNGNGSDNADYEVWTAIALEDSGLAKKSRAGVCSSLVKKGLAGFSESTGRAILGSDMNNSTCHATQAGVDAWLAHPDCPLTEKDAEEEQHSMAIARNEVLKAEEEHKEEQAKPARRPFDPNLATTARMEINETVRNLITDNLAEDITWQEAFNRAACIIDAVKSTLPIFCDSNNFLRALNSLLQTEAKTANEVHGK